MSVDTRIFDLTRGIQHRRVELRATNNFEIAARAIKYNALSQDLGGFKERIAPGAFSDSLNRGDEIVCLVNHDANQPLGRTRNGSLTIVDSPAEMNFRCKLNKAVQAHRDLYELVKDGTISECSFAFNCDKQSWDDSGPTVIRTVEHGRLWDLSVVLQPAYSDGATMAEARKNGDSPKPLRLVQAIATLRKVTQAALKELRVSHTWERDADPNGTSQMDFASMMARCHEAAEYNHQLMRRADECLANGDDDADEDCRAAFRLAHAHSRLQCEQMAQARLLHKGKAKK
jgi:HK97 family phage prohead protease